MGKETKAKKPLPPKLPPKAAYFVYRDQVYQDTKRTHRSMNKGDLAELISNEWDKLPKEQKQNYQAQYEQLKKDYESQKEEYEREYGPIDPAEQTKREALEAKKLEDIGQKKEGKSKSQGKSKGKSSGKEKSEGKKSKKAKKKSKDQSQTEQNEDSDESEEKPKKGKSKEKLNKSKGIARRQQKSKEKGGKKGKKGKKKEEDENFRTMWVVDKNADSQDED